MLYLILFIALVAVAYLGWRLSQTRPAPPAPRVKGPDDDPDFLRRISRGDNNPS